MPTGKLDCAETARHYRDLVKENVGRLSYAPGLAVILGGEDPGSLLYRDLLLKDCRNLGIRAHSHLAGGSLDTVKLIAHLNQDPATHGIFIFYPLSWTRRDPQAPGGEPGLGDDEIMDLVDPGKDIEGLHALNLGFLDKFRKRWPRELDRPCMMPCTGRAVLKVIKRGFGEECFRGRTVLIINDSLRIGRPLAAMVANLRATPILCHQNTRPEHLEGFARMADIIVSAVPQEGYRIPAPWIRRDAICMDLSHQGNFDFPALEAAGILHTNTSRNSIGKVTRAMALLNLTYAAGAG